VVSTSFLSTFGVDAHAETNIMTPKKIIVELILQNFLISIFPSLFYKVFYLMLLYADWALLNSILTPKKLNAHLPIASS
jgi:hypothetical protein